MIYSKVETIIFKGKQNVDWNKVEDYIGRYKGQTFIVEEYLDTIIVNRTSADEYAESKDTKRLRGALAKAKANAAIIIPELIRNATNRRWIENKNPKHANNASGGWYRYDVGFALPAKAENEVETRWKYYRGTMIVRLNNRGMFFYDIINIKKEARTPQGS